MRDGNQSWVTEFEGMRFESCLAGSPPAWMSPNGWLPCLRRCCMYHMLRVATGSRPEHVCGISHARVAAPSEART